MNVQSQEQDKAQLIGDEARTEIDRWLKKFPNERKQAALLQALHIVQKQNGGWLNEELIRAVAKYLHVPAIAALEVATFYTMYDLKPTGRHKIYICTNISCMLNGSKNIVEHLQSRLGIKVGETTTDGRFTLKEAECLAACGGAPACMIGKKYYEDLTPEKLDTIIAEHK